MSREEYLTTGPDGTSFPECARCDVNDHTEAIGVCFECHDDVCEEHSMTEANGRIHCTKCARELAAECAA